MSVWQYECYSSEHWWMWHHEICGPILFYTPNEWTNGYTWWTYVVMPQE